MGKKITSFLVFAAMLFALPMNAQSVRAAKSIKDARPAIYVPKTVKKPLTVIEKKEASEPTMLLTAVEKAQAEKEAFINSRPLKAPKAPKTPKEVGGRVLNANLLSLRVPTFPTPTGKLPLKVSPSSISVLALLITQAAVA